MDTTSTGDNDCAAGVRAVVGTLASSNHCENAQMGLVTELKSALTRAANLPESLVRAFFIIHKRADYISLCFRGNISEFAHWSAW